MQTFSDIDHLPDFKDTVVTIGSFDGIHHGHRQIIKRLVEIATETGKASVVITFEPHPRLVLHPEEDTLRLLNLANEKEEILKELRVDYLVLAPFTKGFSQLSSKDYITKFLVGRFHPSTIIIGYDHRFGNDRSGDINLLKEMSAQFGYTVEEISKQTVDDLAISSTKIRKALNNGEVVQANKLLGYDYFLSGKVVHGANIGTSLGYPTANIEPKSKYKLIPMEGIYAIRAHVDGICHTGMLYIGRRPTLGSDLDITIEANLFNFSGDLYGKEIKIQFVDFIRGDATFDSMEALANQIAVDELRACEVLGGR